MNKSIAINSILLIVIISFIGMINYKAKGISLTHLNCVSSDKEQVEFNIFFDEKNKIIYYADGFTVEKLTSDNRFNITPSKISYVQDRIFNSGDKDRVTFFDDIDRNTLKFKRLVEFDSSRAFEKPRTGICKVETS